MKPTVSVIVSNFNGLAYLPRAIESIWQQNIIDLEIVIVDDGSTDTSWKWICQQCELHSNIISLKLDHVGSSTARNQAVRIASGKYIAFLNSDDYWYPEKLNRQMDVMEANPSMGFCFTNYDRIDKTNTYSSDCFSYWHRFNLFLKKQARSAFQLPAPAADIFAENIVGTSSVMVKRDLYLEHDGFDHKLSGASDWDLWLKLALHTNVGCITSTLTANQIHIDTENQNPICKLAAMECIIRRYEDKIADINYQSVRTAYARLAEAYGEYHRQMKNPIQALFCDLKAIIGQPDKRRIQNIRDDLKQMFFSIKPDYRYR